MFLTCVFMCIITFLSDHRKKRLWVCLFFFIWKILRGWSILMFPFCIIVKRFSVFIFKSGTLGHWFSFHFFSLYSKEKDFRYVYFQVRDIGDIDLIFFSFFIRKKKDFRYVYFQVRDIGDIDLIKSLSLSILAK